MRKLLKITTILLLISSVLLLVGCKKKNIVTNNLPPVTLTYYKLFENEENLTPIFTKFKQQNPHITIVYKKFTDPEQYLDTIVSEIAEGGGPDIMSVPNTWVAQNYRKLTPAPETVATPQAFNDVFVNVASRDNIIYNQEGIGQVYGFPLSVDTLALFYNDSHFETEIPERGRPSSTWEGIVNDVIRLTVQDSSSLDRFSRTGIALGKADNILRASDIFYLLLLQNDINFYSDDFKSANFARNSDTEDVLDFYTSFADENSSNYSWNQFTSDSESAEQELISFVTGKTSMIFGYSYTYKDVLNQIQIQKRNGEDVINASDVQITESPQLADAENPVAYANYFTEVVSRNSDHTQEAWLLLAFMIDQENLQEYYSKDFKPTSLRNLIPEQRENPIYGAFINQLGYATTIPIVDQFEYDAIITELIESAPQQEQKRQILIDAENKINSLIPNEGAYPIAE